jgi:alkylation response protein AidB-like acyl-CoA dehydrogenase
MSTVVSMRESTSTNPALARQSDRLYHDLLSPQEVVDVRAWARRVAAERVAPAAARIANGNERVDGFPADVFHALADQGLFGVPFGAWPIR